MGYLRGSGRCQGRYPCKLIAEKAKSLSLAAYMKSDNSNLLMISMGTLVTKAKSAVEVLDVIEHPAAISSGIVFVSL